MANETASRTVSVGTLANLFNLTPMRVQQLAQMKVVIKADRGRYDVWQSVRGYIRYLQDRALGKSGEPGNENGYEAQRTRLYKARADTQEIIAARMHGTVHDAEVIAAVMNDMVARARARLLAIPTICAPKVADVADPNQCLDILKDAVYEALAELAAYPADEVVARQLKQSLPVRESEDVGDPDDDSTEPGPAGVPDA